MMLVPQRQLIFALCGSLILGIVVYALFSESIVIHITRSGDVLTKEEKQAIIAKKTIRYYYPLNDELVHEEYDLMWHENKPAQNIEHLLQQYLLTLNEEQVTDGKVGVEHAFISPSGEELYVNFEQPLLPQEASVNQKLLILHGLLKTLANAGVSAEQVYFLHNHQLMNDTHLDLHEPWPLKYYL